jgi:hypothetical protein
LGIFLNRNTSFFLAAKFLWHIEQFPQLRKWSIMNGIEVKIPEAELPCDKKIYILSFEKGFLVFT